MASLPSSCDPPEVSRAAQKVDPNIKYECMLPDIFSYTF